MTALDRGPGLVTVLALQDCWHRLTRTQRGLLAVLARNSEPLWRTPQRRTWDALRSEGLVDAEGQITELGQWVVKWRPGKDREVS